LATTYSLGFLTLDTSLYLLIHIVLVLLLCSCVELGGVA
jgi:hypothetical protein